ncbi:MAG: TorF family putative porin [Azoarcus sp.]|jgi:uncharacterized protein (TIGR02001 family)|nr:TorF family putative porin [Azoarcus sp.]
MRKTIAASVLVAALPLASVVQAEESASPFSANVSIVSDYAYRGISQTDEKPALQGGFDFKHSSGLYIGVWGSSISWLRDAETNVSSSNSVELDLYAGYAKSFDDFGLDIGVLRYGYPGTFNRKWRDDTGLKDPNTVEGYVGASWKFVSFKYSYSFTNLFGTPDSEGSDYFDLTLSHEIVTNLTLSAHIGKQRVFGPSESYNDWKVGATYNLGGFDIGLHYVDTDIHHAKDVNADDRIILSIGKSF